MRAFPMEKPAHCMPPTQACGRSQFPSRRGVLPRRKTPLSRGSEPPRAPSVRGGRRAVSKHPLWPLAGRKLLRLPPRVCSGSAAEIRISCCKGESSFRIQSLADPGNPARPPRRGTPAAPAPRHPRRGGWAPPRPKQRWATRAKAKIQIK